MAQWPTSVATNAQLYIAVNALQTTLSGSINNSVTTITLASTTGFQTAGAVTIDNEVIFYTGVSGANLTGCVRGSDGTTAASHTSGVPVGATVVAAHHNLLKDEIIAIETSLNFTASRAMTSNSSGRLTVSTVSDTELGYLSGVTSAIQTQIDAKLSKSGGTMSGAIAMGTSKITGLGNGTAAQDAVAFTQAKVLQVVMATSTTLFSTTNSTFTATNLSGSITPSNSSNKILVLVYSCIQSSTDGGSATIRRGGSNILASGGQIRISNSLQVPVSLGYLDSPASTSALTYDVAVANNSGGGAVQWGEGNRTQVLLLIEVNGV